MIEAGEEGSLIEAESSHHNPTVSQQILAKEQKARFVFSVKMWLWRGSRAAGKAMGFGTLGNQAKRPVLVGPNLNELQRIQLKRVSMKL